MAKLSLTAKELLDLRPYLDTSISLEITEADEVETGALKQYLCEFYSLEREAEISGQKTTLEKAGSAKTVYIEGRTDLNKDRYTFADLLRIMSRLTAEDGCSWDKAQTHESIRSNMIEEAYEAVDAIDAGDTAAMKEEFGDVLLQAVFHCNMGERAGEFTTGDVISELCSKLYFRHTHIFGKDKASSPEQALKFWEQAKAVEKSYTSLYDVLSRLPKGFPSLLRAQKAVKKAVKAGLEEKAEPLSEEELGRELFTLCRRAAAGDADAETALNKKTAEYIDGFAKE